MPTDNTEVYLFAEDLVSYLMNKILWKNSPFRSVNVAPKLEGLRKDIYNGFNETMRKAVDILHESLSCSVESRFNDIVENGKLEYKTLKECAKSIWECYFSDGVDAVGYLKYCVILTGLAGRFYMNGWKGSPDTIIPIIVNRFPFPESITWDTLCRLAENFVKEKSDHGKSSPLEDSKPSVKSTENECSNDLSVTQCKHFQTEIKGSSFIEVYERREHALMDHYMVCLKRHGNMPIKWDPPSSKKNSERVQSTRFSKETYELISQVNSLSPWNVISSKGASGVVRNLQKSFETLTFPDYSKGIDFKNETSCNKTPFRSFKRQRHRSSGIISPEKSSEHFELPTSRKISTHTELPKHSEGLSQKSLEESSVQASSSEQSEPEDCTDQKASSSSSEEFPELFFSDSSSEYDPVSDIADLRHMSPAP